MSRLPDPEDWFEIEDRKQAAFEASLPRCDCCNQPMTEWYRIPQKFGDLLVCTDCAVKEYWED